jgi:hypothetical protein
MSYDIVDTLPDVDENELVNVFTTITDLITNAIKNTSPDHGGEVLASIHYKLFLDFEENKHDKSRLALMYLQSQLSNIISQAGKKKEIGQFLYGYTRHWLKFILIFESEMSSFLSWWTFKPEIRNMVPYISSIEDYLPVLVDVENTEPLPENVIKEFQEFADASNDDAGEELKNWLQGLMRQALFYEDDFSKKLLQQFQKSFSDLMKVFDEDFAFNVQFNTLLHQYGESWYEEIKKRKIWLNKLITKLDLFNEESLDRLVRGFYWRKLDGEPLKQVITKVTNK